ncbi:MAG: hypothetical protein WBA46_11675 [Thermomicrobiales bacterium]
MPVFALRDTLPIVPAPREQEGSGLPWRPVLFGLGAVVGFAVVLQRARKAPAPAHPATATSSGVADSSVGRSIHLPRPRPLPAPLRDSIEAELRADGPLLFSPPDAIDPIGAEALEADGDDQERGGT